MNSIDWSLAPEDATHALQGTTLAGFFKSDGGAYQWVGGKWRFMSVMLEDCLFHSDLIERPAPQNDESQNVARFEWNGEGLPPVGAICEADVDGIWHKCTLLAHCVAPKLGFAVGQISAGLAIGEASDFRPIRTPDQIAADEMEKEAIDMHARFGGIGGLTMKQCIWVISEGYRKQEAQ